MKKKLIIIAAFCYMVFNNSYAQDTIQQVSEKKKYTNLVLIETTTGETITAAFEKFAPDTIFIAHVEEKQIKAGGKFIKVLKDEPGSGIAVNEIKSFKIKNDRNIVYDEDLVKRKKTLRKQHGWKIAGIVTIVAITIPVAIVTQGSVIPLEALPINTTNAYQSFKINGDNTKYLKMVKRLSKNKRNPFEDSIAKK